MEPWLSADQTAAHLGVTKDTVYTWIAKKARPAHKIGRLWKFQASEVDGWVRTGAAASDLQPLAPQPSIGTGGHAYVDNSTDREGRG